VLRRGLTYAVMRPGREMLFTALSPQEKYKAKNFIDTVVYRGGDAVNAWLYAGLSALGLGPGGIAIAAVPLAAGWLAMAVGLGRTHGRFAESAEETPVAGKADAIG
jgi:AAA family ATP:ADP antiporter